MLAAVALSDAELCDTRAASTAVVQGDANAVDLSVAITSTDNSVVAAAKAGRPTYTVTVTNNSSSNATGVVLRDVTTLKERVLVQSVAASNGTHFSGSDGTGTWTVGNLAGGASATLVLSLCVANDAPLSTDSISHTATVTAADQTLINTADDSASIVTSIVHESDMFVQTIIFSDKVTAGGDIFYSVQLVNLGPNDPGNVTLTQVLPAGTTFVSVTEPSGDWHTTTPDVGERGTITSTMANFGTWGASCTFDFVIKAGTNFSEGDIIPITTTVSSSVADPNSSNNSTTVDINVHLTPAPFTQMESLGFPDVWDSAIVWGDYDNDGKMDCAISGFNADAGPIAVIYHNDGNGKFHDIDAQLTGVSESAMAWGDYDNDGRLDLLAAGATNMGEMVTTLYHNDGHGRFHDVEAGLAGVFWSSVTWGDYDNDGLMDIALTGENTARDYITQIYHNDGDGRFHDIAAPLLGVRLGGAAWADYDCDGRLDILVTGESPGRTSNTRLYHNDGNGLFSEVQAGLTPVCIGASAWADYDNDGRPDVFLSGIAYSDGTSVVQIFHNDGNGQFHDINVGIRGFTNCSVAWGDYDNDGSLDFLLDGHVFHNDGDGQFTEIDAQLIDAMAGTVTWWDMDGDGRLDILLTGLSEANKNAWVYHNTAKTPNASPSKPKGLTQRAASSTSSTLSWTPATDDHTPSASLSYDLYIGTAPGARDVAAVEVAGAMTAQGSSPAKRNLPRPGAVSGTRYTVTGLTPGRTYYWSVRAVDGALANSALTGHSFVFTGGAATQAVVTTPSGAQAGNVTIKYRLLDTESARCNIAVEYSDDGGTTWKTAAAGTGGDGTANLTSSARGVSHTFVWDSGSDIVDVRNPDVLIRITPTDITTGTAGTTGKFLVDNVPRQLSIDSVQAADAASGWKKFVFHVTLSDSPVRPVTVHFATQDGTATTANRDYAAKSGTLAFQAGTTQLTKTITVSVRGTMTYRDDKIFSVVLSDANAEIATGVGVGTILNDAAVPRPIVKSVALKEGDSGQADATFVVTLSSPTELDVPLTYATVDGTATVADNDYVAASRDVVFPARSKSLSITVPVIGDLRYENNETFMLRVLNAMGVAATGVHTIVKDDRVPKLSLGADQPSITEPASGSLMATFTVSLTAASGLPVTVGYATSPSSALAGKQYTTTQGTLTFTPGETSKTISVPILNDGLYASSPLSFRVFLSKLRGASAGTLSVTETIVNSDSQPAAVATAQAPSRTATLLPTTPTSTASRRVRVAPEALQLLTAVDQAIHGLTIARV